VKLNAKQLRVTLPTEEQLSKIKRRPIYIVLDNVLDTYNVGSIFRLADAIAAQEVVLCGQTETPPNSRIHKAAVGTETWISWRYFSKTLEALKLLKLENPELKIIAVEQDRRSVSLSQITITNQPIAIVVGHETEGISKEALDLADAIVEIPMQGINKSLNVHVAASIVLYKLISFV